jgi:hypothetical protein
MTHEYTASLELTDYICSNTSGMLVYPEFCSYWAFCVILCDIQKGKPIRGGAINYVAAYYGYVYVMFDVQTLTVPDM